MIRRRLLPLLLPLLAAACAGAPGPFRDCGAAPRDLPEMTVILHLHAPEKIAAQARVERLAPGRLVRAYIRTYRVAFGDFHELYVPLPRDQNDWRSWHALFHELRHANGETHDERGCWLPPAPAAPAGQAAQAG